MSERDDLAILGEAHGWTPTRRSIEEKARRQIDALRRTGDSRAGEATP